MAANKQVREFISKSGVKHWEIALRLGISEQTLVRWLRVPLLEHREALIISAVNAIVKEGQSCRM